MAVIKLGITGVYILVLGALARHALSAPRAVGVGAFLLDLFVVAVAAVVALLGVRAMVERSVEREEKGRNGQLLAGAKRRIRERLFLVGLFAAIAVLVVVGIDHIEALDWLTLYYVMLFLASLPSSVLAESVKEALSI